MYLFLELLGRALQFDGAVDPAAKHGIIGLSKSATLDYAAENIRINVVAPGIVDTEMMDRFSGGIEESRQSVGWAGRRRSQRRPSPPDSRWSSTAVKQCKDGR